mmetsp:Transcript_2828/g.4115  ORF Transcript_2828/g.4115 Transcript_2828/m.4115 type:complete len:207 (+) Transcript_2828:317-937(+)
MFFFPILRVFVTASTCFPRPYLLLTSAFTAALDTKAMDVPPTAPGCAPYIGRITTGCGVGMDAFGSPICDHAIVPPLMIISGLDPNLDGFHRTISASFSVSREPTRWDMPWAIAGLMVYLATYLLTRALSSPLALSSSRAPVCFFILSAVCHVRVMTSPTLPIACESEDMIEIAPMSCNTSSAAMVSPRIRDSANATSSLMFLSRW